MLINITSTKCHDPKNENLSKYMVRYWGPFEKNRRGKWEKVTHLIKEKKQHEFDLSFSWLWIGDGIYVLRYALKKKKWKKEIEGRLLDKVECGALLVGPSHLFCHSSPNFIYYDANSLTLNSFSLTVPTYYHQPFAILSSSTAQVLIN